LKVGKYARKHNHRLSFHVDHFVQLGTLRPHVLANSIKDLNLHAKIIKAMGYTMTDINPPIIIIHCGGTFGNKTESLARWIKEFKTLQPELQFALALENDENSCSINDLLQLCETNNILFCLDVFHNQVSKDQSEITPELFKRCMNTWIKKGLTPKIHISEQKEGGRRGAHGDVVSEFPPYLVSILKSEHVGTNPNFKLDMMIEAKNKELATLSLYEKYFDLVEINNKKIWLLNW